MWRHPMRHDRQFISVLLIIQFIGCCTLQAADCPRIAGSGSQTPLDKALTAPTAQDTLQAYNTLIGGSDPQQLQDLKEQSHDGVALQAAWHETLNDALAEIPNPPMDAKLSKRRLCRFLGFVEGRLRTTPPEWWEQVVLSARASHRPDLSFDFVVEKHAEYHRTELGPYAPEDTNVTAGCDRVVLRYKDDTLSIPPSIADQLTHLGEKNFSQCVSALIGPTRWYIVIYSSLGESAASPELYCIDRKTGRVLWKTTISTNHELVLYQGRVRPGKRMGAHSIALRQHQKRVLVFGAEHSSVYIFGFDTKNGRNMFRFSTDYR